MATPDRDSGKPGRDRLSAKSTTDPVLRNTLRYTISAKEYQVLHKYIISRSKVLKRNTPTVSQVEKLVDRPGRDDHNAAAVRASLRVFLATGAALKAWAVIKETLFKGKADTAKTTLWRSPTLRLSLSLSSILLLHRLLFRFFTRLRAHLLTADAQPFRRRNPRTSQTLTSRFAPAVGASLAGFMLGVYPGEQLRLSLAIYVLSQAAEATYNLAEEQGWIWGKKGSRWERPWWFGSWMLMPLVTGQLLHAFIFDRDCFPDALNGFMTRFSPPYIQGRPADYPSNLPWPAPGEVVDSLAEMGRLRFPPFVSPILFPNKKTLPTTLQSTAPITDVAHPLITSLSCALLHPNDPSCARTYLTYWLRAFPRFARIFAVVFAVFSLPKYKAFYNAPIASLDQLGRSVLRTSAFATGSVGTAWAAICFFQNFLPSKALPTQRFFLGGFLAGLWSFLERETGRGNFLYMSRLSMDSVWKVGVKRGWWKSLKGGDVWLFVAALAVVNAVYTKDHNAIKGGAVRRVLAGLRGETAALRSLEIDGDDVDEEDKKER
ncbi:hypothetical protein V494_01395 [Pseudogymnoascus sp. VKM F-4513 (FW-928)]|nr:hypothetical protein V494_01395 [Pseudogymnoascus sp. VKM F-4513 (FW-928)]